MELWKKVRGGAYFIDVLLLIAAIIAIAGLITFVHLHAGKTPSQNRAQAALALNPKHLDTLSLDSSTATPSSSHPEDASKKPATTSSPLQSAATAPEAASPAAACVNSDCDNTILNTNSVKSPPAPTPIVVEQLPVPVPIKPCDNSRYKQVSNDTTNNVGTIECRL
jgi:hypothetical protein